MSYESLEESKALIDKIFFEDSFYALTDECSED